ncbi:MAG: MFS transporter [Micromonosporaceae bacterium]
MTTATAPVAAPTRDGDRPVRRRGLVTALAVTQTVGYGTLYYAFAVVLAPMATQLRTSTAVVTGALTLAVVVTAAAAIPVGRWLDRHGGHGLMTAGSVLGTAALVAWSQVETVGQLYAVFAAIGVASAMVLYEPAFAILIAVLDPARRAGALLTVTIVAGFASSIFIPLTGLLTDRYGWRTAIAVLAAVHALTTVPLHALALRDNRRPRRSAAGRDAEPPGLGTARASRSANAVERDAGAAPGAGHPVRDPGFWLLTAGFVTQGGALAVIAVHLVSYLVVLGHSAAFAATATGLLGVLSVTGRVVTTGLRRWLPVRAVTAVVFALQGLAVAGLPVLGRSGAGAIVCVTVFGLGFGVATLARPAILADRYGTTRYATIAGALATPATLAKATAPLGAAVLALNLGYTALMTVVAGACLVAAGCLLLTPAVR